MNFAAYRGSSWPLFPLNRAGGGHERPVQALYGGLPWYGQIGVGALVVSSFGGAGWLAGDLFWPSPSAGLAGGLTALFLVNAATNADMRIFLIGSVRVSAVMAAVSAAGTPPRQEAVTISPRLSR